MKKLLKTKWFYRGITALTVVVILITLVITQSTNVKAASMTWGATDDWQYNPDFNHNETAVTDSAGRNPASCYDLYYNLIGGDSYDKVNHTSFQGYGNASEDVNNKNARGYAIALKDDSNGSWVYVGNSEGNWRATNSSNTLNGMYVTREIVQVNDKQSALIKMVIHNTNSYDKTASLATSADLEVGGDDNAYLTTLSVEVAGKKERAGFTTTNKYMTGVSDNKKISLNYYFRYNSYIDEAMAGTSYNKENINIWYGEYKDRWINLWNNTGKETINTTNPHGGTHGSVDNGGNKLTDTSFCASWNGVEVPANGTATVAYVLTVCNTDSKTINYNANGGSGSMPTDTRAYLSSYTIRDNGFTAPVGRYFAGWSNTSNGSVVYYPNNTITVTENMTLYAVWNPNTYYVLYDNNWGNNADWGDGNGSVNVHWQTCTYDSSQPVLANRYTKDGYVFLGWNTKRDGSGTWYNVGDSFINLIAENDAKIVLYAQWGQARSFVEYYGNGSTEGSNYIKGHWAINNDKYDDGSAFNNKGHSFDSWLVFSQAGFGLGNKTGNDYIEDVKGITVIKPKNNIGSCVDIAFADYSDYAPVGVYPCTSADNQV